MWVFQDLGYESGGEGSLFRGWRGQVDDVAGSWLMDLCACMCLHKSVSVGKVDGEQRAAGSKQDGRSQGSSKSILSVGTRNE